MPVPKGNSAILAKGHCVGCETAGTDEHAARAGQLFRQRAVQFSSHINADGRRVVLTLNVKGYFYIHIVIASSDKVYPPIACRRCGLHAPPLSLQQPFDVFFELDPAHFRVVCRRLSASS